MNLDSFTSRPSLTSSAMQRYGFTVNHLPFWRGQKPEELVSAHTTDWRVLGHTARPPPEIHFRRGMGVQRAEPKFCVDGGQGRPHIFLGDNEREFALRSAMRRRDRIHIGAVKRAKSTPDHSGHSADFLSDNSNNRNGRIDRYVFDFLVSQILRELAPKFFNRQLRETGRDDQASLVL